MLSILPLNRVAPSVALVFKDVSQIACHAGLGVTAINIAACLKDAGIRAETWPVFDGYVLQKKLMEREKSSQPITHVMMLAPWVDTGFLRMLTAQFPRVQFTVTCHSNVGFLQIDAWSMKVLLEQTELERDRLNFRASGNCIAYCRWITAAFNRPCAYLPNLFHVQMPPVPRRLWNGGTLRFGIFGATRVLKNIGTAVAASLVMAKQLSAETEIWMSGGREEGGKGVRAACEAMVRNAPHVRIVESPWQTWAQFGTTVSRMHLMLQPSFTESFNNVTADGVAHGVASVVSPAIDWAPSSWKGDPDDACELAAVGMRLLRDRRAAARGMKALRRHNQNALTAWKAYLA